MKLLYFNQMLKSICVVGQACKESYSLVWENKDHKSDVVFKCLIFIVVCSKMCLRAQYLRLAILMSIGEEVAVDVSERRNPGENGIID